jgi:hypothetical protein
MTASFQGIAQNYPIPRRGALQQGFLLNKNKPR